MAKTFEPTRIGTWPSPPVPWLIGGSGRGNVCERDSPSRASSFAAKLSLPSPPTWPAKPRANWRPLPDRACGPLAVPDPAGSPSARSSSPLMPSGSPRTRRPHEAWPPEATGFGPPVVSIP